MNLRHVYEKKSPALPSSRKAPEIESPLLRQRKEGALRGGWITGEVMRPLKERGPIVLLGQGSNCTTGKSDEPREGRSNLYARIR